MLKFVSNKKPLCIIRNLLLMPFLSFCLLSFQTACANPQDNSLEIENKSEVTYDELGNKIVKGVIRTGSDIKENEYTHLRKTSDILFCEGQTIEIILEERYEGIDYATKNISILINDERQKDLQAIGGTPHLSEFSNFEIDMLCAGNIGHVIITGRNDAIRSGEKISHFVYNLETAELQTFSNLVKATREKRKSKLK